MSFVKLYGGILDSSVWEEPYATRVVWIALLALADQDGFVELSAAGLRRRANVTREECAAALERLEAPDPDSRTSEHDGRRIERVEGGWVVLNYSRYRDRQTRRQAKDAQRQRRRRDGDVSRSVTPCHALSRSVTPSRPDTDTDTDTEAEAEKNQRRGRAALDPFQGVPIPENLDTPGFREAWDDWLAYRSERKLATWKPRTIKTQLRDLSEAGEVVAVQALRQSIKQGWQGVFPEKVQRGNEGRTSDPYRDMVRDPDHDWRAKRDARLAREAKAKAGGDG